MSATLEIALFGPSLDTQKSELRPMAAPDQGAKSSISFQETQETLTVVSTRT
jgi:hypothetical protein